MFNLTNIKNTIGILNRTAEVTELIIFFTYKPIK